MGKATKPIPDNGDEVDMNVSIPRWLKELVEKAAATEGRKLKAEVARRLKMSFGLKASAQSPKDIDGEG